MEAPSPIPTSPKSLAGERIAKTHQLEEAVKIYKAEQEAWGLVMPNKVKKKLGGTRRYGTDDGGRGYDGEA